MTCGCSHARDGGGSSGWSRECATLGTALAMSGAAVGAYHGYKRNDSVGWALTWAVLGAIAPVIVIPIAIAQGLGEPAPPQEQGRLKP